LVNRGTFTVFRLIPLSISVDKGKFPYTETENRVLYVDQTRQYYITTRDELITVNQQNQVHTFVNRRSLC
jgi:hypothetical protein